MNRVVLFEQDRISNDQFIIRDEARLKHLTSHLKISTGDLLRAAIIGHGLASVAVHSLNNKEVILKVTDDFQRPCHNDISLIVATSRPPTMKKVIEHGTTLGVKHFHFFSAALSEKSYLQSKVLEESKLNELATLGLSQSGQLWQMPTFEFSKNLKQALEKQNQNSSQNYLLSLRGERTLLNSRPDFNAPCAFFIGPERGWTNQEEDYLIENKVVPILLSQHILRVETAAFALLSQMELLQLS